MIEDLQELAANEAQGVEDAPETDPASEYGPIVEDAPQRASMPSGAVKMIAANVASVIGTMICTRARVDPLSPDEIEKLADASAELAAEYDLGNLSPRAAAWIGIGVAVFSVAAPRIEQVNARRAAPPATALPEDTGQPGWQGPDAADAGDAGDDEGA